MTLPNENRILVLQGGGALGAYQAGAYEALASAGEEPEWVAGISIGAINAAIIAGNRPEDRVNQLRRFWEKSFLRPAGLILPAGTSRAHPVQRNQQLAHQPLWRAGLLHAALSTANVRLARNRSRREFL